MSNLSDLIPAGASAKQLTFTDSGSGIATKKPVVLNSDGTVAEAGEITYAIGTGSATNYTGSSDEGNYVNIAYDTVNDKMLLVYTDSSTGYGTGVVGTVSGTTLSWGTPVVFQSASMSYTWVAFDTSAEKFLIVFRESGLGYGMVGTISGTSVSYAGKTRVDGGGSSNGYGGLAYDSNAAACVNVYYRSGYSPEVTVNTISGSTITSSSAVSFGTSGDFPLDITYDSTAQKVIICYQGSSNYIRAIVGTVSGASISFGSELNTGLPTNGNGSVSYDPVQDKTLLYFNETSGSQTGYFGVMTVTGTSLGIGSYVANTTGGEGYIIVRYNAASASHVAAWSTGSAGKARDVTISGTTPTPDATITDWSTDYLDYIGMAYDPDQKVMVIGTKNDVAPLAYSIVYRSVYTGTNLTATNFVGIADSAISASAAGSVIVQGGTVTGLTYASSTMSFGSPVNFDGAGWKQKNRMAYDTTNNRVVNIYEDNTGTGYVTAVVGTVSGTTTEWGTAVVVKSAVTNGVSIAYDTNAQKMVAYYNSGSAHYARVGTVSGSGTGATISFGTEVTVVAANADLCAIAYDANAQKVVVTVEESSVLKALVGTVAGTDITFGTAASFYSGDANNPGPQIAYDANAQKVVIQYTKTSDSYGYAIVGTVAGTDITFGTEASYSAATNRNNDISYDSTAQKLFLSFRDSSNNSTGIVGTIAGTDITFGAVATAITGGTQGEYSRCVYDPDNDITIVVGSVNSVGTVAAATISGTSASFSSPQTFNAFSTSEFGLTYDTTADKAVVVYGYYDGAGISPAVVITTATPFTTGTKYYVTTSGGFSSSAGDPSVNAGLAISTTSLLLNGDS